LKNKLILNYLTVIIISIFEGEHMDNKVIKVSKKGEDGYTKIYTPSRRYSKRIE